MPEAHVHVVHAFEALQQIALVEMEPLLEYFEEWHIGRQRLRHAQVQPKYTHALCDVYRVCSLVDGYEIGNVLGLCEVQLTILYCKCPGIVAVNILECIWNFGIY